MKKLVLPFRAAMKAFKAVADMSKLADKHGPSFQRAVLIYKDAESSRKLGRDGERLFLRAEGAYALFQLSIPVVGKGIEDGWKAVVEIPKLANALSTERKARPETVDLTVNEASVRIGRIRIKTEDPSLLLRTPPGIAEADVMGKVPNPSTEIERVQHCVANEGVPSFAVLPGQILAAHLSQAILVDCDLLRADSRIMVPAREAAFVRHIGDTVDVRLSISYLVLRGDDGMLALQRLRWSKAMDEPVRLFSSASFVDEIEVQRDDLLQALKTATKILGKDADAELVFRADGGSLRSAVEGDEVQLDFGAEVKSGKTYSLGLMVQMLLRAVEHSPGTSVFLKVPDLSAGPVNMIHIVDAGSHEVIALGTTGQLKEHAG